MILSMRDSAFAILLKPEIEAIIIIKDTSWRAMCMTFVEWLFYSSVLASFIYFKAGSLMPKKSAMELEKSLRAVISSSPSHRRILPTPSSGDKAEPAKPEWAEERTMRSSPTSSSWWAMEYFPGGAPAAAMQSVVKSAFPGGFARKKFFKVDGGR